MTTILYIEDNEDNIFVFMRRLSKKGYDVIIAHDGEAGISMAHSERPSLILMDLDLPVVDGWEATRLLKASPETSHIPVIAVSAYAMVEDQRRALDTGCDDFISKPVDMKALGGFQREVQHHEAHEIDRLSRIALENLTGSEVLALDRIASLAKKLKDLNSAGVALRAGTQAVRQNRNIAV